MLPILNLTIDFQCWIQHKSKWLGRPHLVKFLYYLSNFQFDSLVFCMRSIDYVSCRTKVFFYCFLLALCKNSLLAKWMAWIIIQSHEPTRIGLLRYFGTRWYWSQPYWRLPWQGRPWHTTVFALTSSRTNCFSLIHGTGR